LRVGFVSISASTAGSFFRLSSRVSALTSSLGVFSSMVDFLVSSGVVVGGATLVPFHPVHDTRHVEARRIKITDIFFIKDRVSYKRMNAL